MTDPATVTPGHEYFLDVSKLFLSALFGGILTAAAALPIYNTKLARLAAEMASIKESCTLCRSSITTSVDTLSESVKEHHEDDDKHCNSATATILSDILARVMRIEGRLFNGDARKNH